jgi:hypothetical protein
MLVRLVDFDISLVYILGRFDSVLLSVLNNWILRLYDLSHVSEHSCKFRESGFNALEFVVTSADSTENRGSLS